MTTIIWVVVSIIISVFLLLFARKLEMMDRIEENIYEDVDEAEDEEVEYEEVDEESITLGDVYLYFKRSGYLKECQKGDYKFSASRLRVLIKNEELYGISINHPEAAITVNGVGKKVYDLIKHLITKYKEENAINF